LAVIEDKIMLELFFFSYRKYEQNLFTKKKKVTLGRKKMIHAKEIFVESKSLSGCLIG